MARLQNFFSLRSAKLADLLKAGAVGVLPTDTMYGLVAPALDKKAVARVYRLRKRSPQKPCIILISSLEDLALLSVKPSSAMRKILSTLWPGPVSVILPCSDRRFSYLHRGTKTLALRLPKSPVLRSLVSKTGPLVAPSANPEGQKPAKTARGAQKYFGDSVDFYVRAGTKESAPSSVIGIRDGSLVVLRKGAGQGALRHL